MFVKFTFFSADHEIRTFDRVRRNPECDLRPQSQCKIFETFRKPEMIPDDLYEKTKFGHEYDWIITSSEATGKRSLSSVPFIKDYLLKIKGYCYHSVNVITNAWFQSNHIKRLSLYYTFEQLLICSGCDLKRSFKNRLWL